MSDMTLTLNIKLTLYLNLSIHPANSYLISMSPDNQERRIIDTLKAVEPEQHRQVQEEKTW